MKFLVLLLFTAGPASAADLPVSPSAPGARVFIVSPADGAVVHSPFKVAFGIAGMTLKPAGEAGEFSGHHHLLIDKPELPPAGQPLPNNDQIRHFGGGQTETELDLPAGTHTLQLLLGDFEHVPHDPPVQSEKITITVE